LTRCLTETRRDRREEARRLVSNGIDPGAKPQAEKLSKTDTFEAIARNGSPCKNIS